MSSTSDAFAKPIAARHLPLTLMCLDDWAVTRAVGVDAEKYLQGQLTADITEVTASQHTLCAHCDGKGKMWSNVRLFRDEQGFGLILRRSVRAQQLAALKKYAVFSKVTLSEDDDSVLLGLAGEGARAALASVIPQLPDQDTPVIRHEQITILWFNLPTERFLLVLDQAHAQQVQEQLQGKAQRAGSEQWLALDIEGGLPIIDAVNSEQLIPQATNLQALGGISFRKGCYTGQEMVARAKYRGANKRALWLLTGTGERAPAAGDELEMQLGENWRRTGTVLASASLEDGSLIVQAVLSNDLDSTSVFRVRDDADSRLHLSPLPYSLEEA